MDFLENETSKNNTKIKNPSTDHDIRLKLYFKKQYHAKIESFSFRIKTETVFAFKDIIQSFQPHQKTKGKYILHKQLALKSPLSINTCVNIEQTLKIKKKTTKKITPNIKKS